MRIIVAGAGIGGLSTAVALEREGHDVVVVERAPQLTEVGAAIVLGPHAMRVLDALGAAERLRELNTPPQASTYYDLVDGEARIYTELGETGRKLYGTTLYSAHRRDLIDALAAQLVRTQIRLNSTFVDVDQDANSATLVLDSGERISADLLVAADGIRSTIRTRLFGESPATFTGFLAWRTVLPIEKLGHALPPETKLWIGAGRHIVHYPIRHGTQFYAAFYVPASEIHREDWSTSGDVEGLRASFADACPEVRALTEAVDEAFITGIYYRDPLPQWSRGRIILVGDAAHPVLPTSGSGAAVAIEDSIALTRCLARFPGDHAAAFADFQARRQPRTTRLLISSRADLTTYHEENPVKIAARAPMNRAVMRLDPTGHQRLSWLYGYDEVAESAKDPEAVRRSAIEPPQRDIARRAFNLWANALRVEDSIDGWVSEREAFARYERENFPVPDGVTVERIDCDGVPALRVTPANAGTGPMLVHLHGGAFMFGTGESEICLAASMAARLGGIAIIPQFRCVPEHDPLAMAADVRTVYLWAQARSPRCVVSGTCSGANLALRLAQVARDEGATMPVALVLLSPFLRFDVQTPSIDDNARTEAWLSRRRLLQACGAYIQDHEPDDPAIAALAGDLHGLPPVHIYAAQAEALADDARQCAARIEAAGGAVKLTMVPDSVHAFALFAGLAETDALLDDVAVVVSASQAAAAE